MVAEDGTAYYLVDDEGRAILERGVGHELYGFDPEASQASGGSVGEPRFY